MWQSHSALLLHSAAKFLAAIQAVTALKSFLPVPNGTLICNGAHFIQRKRGFCPKVLLKITNCHKWFLEFF